MTTDTYSFEEYNTFDGLTKTCFNTWRDEYDAEYSEDKRVLLKVPMGTMIYDIRQGTEKIGDRAFCLCRSLFHLSIPESVTIIGKEAFAWCSSLREIKLPNALTTIGDEAFGRCESLKVIHIPDSVCSIGQKVFSGCTCRVVAKSPYFITEKTTLFSADKKRLIIFTGQDSSYHIPNGVTTIDDGAFRYSKSLKEIHIPTSVTTIGDGAFERCGDLKEISIPQSVELIRGNPFINCRCKIIADSPYFISNEHILFTADEKKVIAYTGEGRSVDIPISVTTIGEKSFYVSSFIHDLYITPFVQTIQSKAFYGCMLRRVFFLNSVANIAPDSFSDCRLLEQIFIPQGTFDQFAEQLPDYANLLVEKDYN